MCMSFMCLKSWHPNNKANQKKVWIAQHKQKENEKRQKEALLEFEKEQRILTNKKLLTGQDTQKVDFMYAPPPGLEKFKATAEAPAKPGTSLSLQQKFEFLRNAPTQGEYTENVRVQHKPLGKAIRNVKCARCGAWGHTSLDRECPLFNENPNDGFRQKIEDPLASGAMQGQMNATPQQLDIPFLEDDRLMLKQKFTSAKYGGFSKNNPNQQMVHSDEEEDIDEMTLINSLSRKDRKLLLKLIQKESSDKSKKKKSKKRKRESERKSRKSKKRRRSDESGDEEEWVEKEALEQNQRKRSRDGGRDRDRDGDRDRDRDRDGDRDRDRDRDSRRSHRHSDRRQESSRKRDRSRDRDHERKRKRDRHNKEKEKHKRRKKERQEKREKRAEKRQQLQLQQQLQKQAPTGDNDAIDFRSLMADPRIFVPPTVQ